MQGASEQTIDQPSAHTRAKSSRRAPFIAADVGGTHARIGLIEIETTANGRAVPAIRHYQKFTCADHPNLTTILREFVHGVGAESVDRACIACAGYALGDDLINANLPWPVSISQIQRELGFERVALVNDFKAVAYAAHFLGTDNALLIAGDRAIEPSQPRLVVGPGTGLGAAVLISGERHPGILSSEAGHAALAPRTALELQILRRIGNGTTHVLNEQILSGPGLLTLYRVLCELRASPPRFSSPAQITAAALAASDPLAVECLHVFCAWLGSLVGDLMMLFGAYGGVYLAGGVLPQIVPLLQRSEFAERLCSKGALREVLERVPVYLIEHGQLGVSGAAHWYLDNEYDTAKN